MKLLPSRLKIKEHGEKEKWRASPILYLGNFVTRSGLGVIEYLSIVGAKADYLNSLSLKLKMKPKNFENDIEKYLFDLALIKLFDISNVFYLFVF